jgi:hypothetical protein
MRATAIAANISASSVAKKFQRVLLLSALFATASLNSWAQIVVSPASVVFTTKQVVGTTSASKSVTITNNGASAQAVNFVMSGDFTETDNCAGSVAGGGGSCTANIFFSPTLVGSISGAATIVDPSKNLLAFVGLTGTGLAPVTTAPTSLSFGAVAIGTTSATKTFKITNNSPSPINVTGITASSDYTVTNTGTCLSAALNHAATCTVTVDVAPTSPVDNGAIVITHNAPNGLPVVLKLSATGTGGPTTPISVSKTSLTFKVVTGGVSATQTITVTNTSGSPVTMGTTTASNDYAIVNNLCTGSLAAAATCTFGITFNPTFVGSIGGSAAVAYTGNNTPQLVNLTGSSLAPLTVAPPKIAFAAQAVGSTSTAKAVKITNNSASAITLSSIVPSGDFQIQLSGTTCSLTGGSLAAAHNCNVQIQFAPTIAGTIVGSLTVTNSSNPNPLLIALSGTGTNTAAAVLNPASAHQSSSETIVITGTNTHFGATTTVNFGADITLGTLTVNGPTSASVPITIDNVAAIGARNVTITTGAEVVKPTFTVIAGVPAVTLINPNTIQPTQTESVAITGAFTNWVSGTTKANFGPGIAVGGAPAGTFGPVTVNSATSLTASLVTSGATTGFRTVQVQTGSQTLTVNNGMDVETCTATAPTILHISPVYGATSQPLNTQIQAQFSVPMDRTTFSLGNAGSTTVRFYDGTTGQEIPATITVDASGTIATITPTVVLPAGRAIYTYWSYANYVKDACGNDLGSVQDYFTTAYSTDTTGPTLTGTSPVNGDTNIPLNGNASGGTPVVLQFDTPIDPVTVQTGFYMETGGNTVPGNFTYSADDKTVTYTPVSPLTATTSYTVSYSAQITDTTGTPLTNPGSFSFTTGTSAVTTGPSVTFVDPPNNTFGVGVNVTPHLTFNEPVNELTVPPALNLYYENFNIVVPATVTVSADRLSATLTPSAQLLPNTLYYLYLCGYTDIAGNNNASCSNTYFFTGTSGDSTATTVSSITPSDTQTGVPLNVQITVVMNDDIDPTSVSNSSITVKQGSTNIPGTVTLASDGITLTFVPTSALTASKLYNVTVGGFKDIEGNAVTAFNSSFTTGTTGYGNGSFTLVSTNPANTATGVAVNSTVKFTMSNLINAAAVNDNTVYVYINATNQVVAGTYSVNGAAVTFTPLTQYPGNTVMHMYINGLTDAAGNLGYGDGGTFTTANTADTTAPTVTISPANGVTNVGLNTQIVLTFSKSINGSTITPNTLALFNGDIALGYNYTISRDSRTILVNYNGAALPSGATITISLTSGIQDLSGNALANINSQFTLTTALSNTAPYVIAMRPGVGATNVPANTPVTLFTSLPMNAGTVTGALHVIDNGVLVSGAVQLFSNAQAIQFTPGASFNAGDVIQVYLDSSALSASNVPLSSFSAQFTIAGSPANTAAVEQVTNPFVNATNVPLNTVIQVEYNQALLASTVTCNGNSGSVRLYEYATNTALTPNCSVSGGLITITPTSNLVSGSQYQVYVDYASNVTNIDGVIVQAFAYNFIAGTAVDNAAPTIVSQAPTDTATNIGTNTSVAVNFNKAINPVSVTGSTIQLSAGSNNEAPSSISFSPDYTRVSIVPQAPLPPSTQMTVAISGVTSEAGKPVATKTTHFTTAAQPDFTAPYVVSSSVLNGQTNVPVNSVFSMQFSKPMDIGSFNAADVNVYGGNYPSGVPAAVSWSADQTAIFIVPNGVLQVGIHYCLESFYMTDLSGNPEQNFNICFTASFTSNTNPPTVVNTSPENTETLVPVNAPVQVLFSEPIQPTSIGLITLKTGANSVAVTQTFTDGNQLLTLTPTATLAANTSYTLTITGVKDTAGNTMVGTVTNTFTTGPTFDLVGPSVTVADPAPSTTGVGTNVTPRIVFSKRLNPLSVVSSSNELYNNGSVELYDNATNEYVPATVSMSADRLTAILTPSSPLQPNTSYQIYVNYGARYYDVAGNVGNYYNSGFVTGSGSDTGATTVTTLSPANSQTGVPINTQVVAVMSDDIDPTTVTNSSITLKQGSTNIPGTVTLASDGVTLTFMPNSVLPASALLYNVSVSGFRDTEGNAVTTFNSSFTTGTTGYGNGSFTLVSTSPANNATGVSVTSPVTFTMSNLINAASVNPNTVYVYVNATNEVVAGSYSVSGAAVTFTPQSKYPASTLMHMYVNGLPDEAGNLGYGDGGTFTTTNTVDTTPPTATITPANGTSNVGLNAQVVLTFSKSINPATITTGSVNLLNGDVPLNPATSISRDNRTVILNYNGGTLPAGATLTVTATHLITDLSGNALADTTSQFTTTPATSSSAPYVISMRPGIGATVIPTNTVITLFTSAPMNTATIAGALHITQSGALVSGTTTVGSNGQSIEFTPGSALTAGTPVQVFLDTTAQDIYGNYLQNFSTSFTTAGSPTNTAAVEQATNPFVNATNVPLNTVIQVEYNQALLASTVTCNGNSGSVRLYEYATNTALTPNCSVSGGVITISPTSNLVSGSQYQVYVDYASYVTNTNGVQTQAYAFNFTAGTATDNAAPTISSIAPPDTSTNIGTNAGVSVNFNKAINPVSVTGSSIQLSGGSVTEVPSSISFTTDYTRTMVIPQAPLPASTTMAIAISGVTSQAGVSVASKTTHFTTMAGPDFSAPSVIHTSVDTNQVVGTNAAFAMQFNKPMDQGTVNPAGAQYVYLYDNTLGFVAVTISFSTDLTTVMLKPTANLTASHGFQMCSYYMTDLSGNPQNNFCVGFSTGSGTDTTGPVVQRVSPPSSATGVGINAPVQILFNEPISGTNLGGVTLKQSSSVIPTTATLYDGDQGIQLRPLVPLAAGTVYTINVAGVKDITGNTQSSFASQSFTTGTGTDLVTPTVVSTYPTSGQTNIPVNAALQAVFSKAMGPASFDANNSFTLRDASNNVIPASITFSADFKTVTLQPNSNLTGGGAQYYFYIGYWAYLYDVGGNQLSYGNIPFTTH